jgi:DNA primase catalytic subunit
MSKTDHMHKIRAYRNIVYSTDRSRKEIQDYITSEELEKICKYLKNPTSCGLWILKGTWLGTKGITAEIKEELKLLYKSKKEKGKKNLKNEDIEETITESTKKISFVLKLFVKMINLENNKDKLQFYEPDFDNTLIELLNLKKLKDKYTKEIDYFKNQIFFEGFVPSLEGKEFNYIKSGLFFCKTEEIEKHQ